MLVKKYEADNMQQAMDTIIRELGSDAVVLSSQKVKKKGVKNLFSKPVLEVMVAYEPEKKQKRMPSSRMSAYLTQQNEEITPAEKKSRDDEEKKRIDAIDSRIDALSKMVSDFTTRFSHLKREVTYDFCPQVQIYVERMIDNQVREDLACSLAKQAEEIIKKQHDSSAYEVLDHLMKEMIGEPQPIQGKKFQQKVLLFLGPTGVGKTTSLVKMASDFVINQKKKVGIINTDTYRIAAQEQLRTYADILSVPLEIVYQLEDLGDALAEMADRDIIFIDTAGKRPGDEQHRQDIQTILEKAAPQEIFLCIAATTAYPSAQEIVDTYAFVEDMKLLITKTDETKYRGLILNLAKYAEKPFSYITTGQSVPDDMELMDAGAITAQILG